MKLNMDATKVIGLVSTVLGAAASVVSGIANDKKMKENIAKEVAKQVTKN